MAILSDKLMNRFIADELKAVEDAAITAAIYGSSFMEFKLRKPTEVFIWYVGHDPYNSADDEAFMRDVLI